MAIRQKQPRCQSQGGLAIQAPTPAVLALSSRWRNPPRNRLIARRQGSRACARIHAEDTQGSLRVFSQGGEIPPGNPPSRI
jgi:hypothetical protein